MDDFAGKVAVVTGAGSGIGRALVDTFRRAGMRVVGADVDADALVQTPVDLAVATDVSKLADVERLRDAALDAFGAVHVVVNNAGISTSGQAWSADEATWHRVLNVNLWGVINGVRAFVPLLVDQDEGYVVNTASMQGLSVTVGGGPYAVSKFGVVALSEVLRLDLAAAGSNVNVSVLCPGPVATNIASNERVRAWLAENGRPPAEVADLVLDAMKARRFYILTATDRLDDITRRAEEIVSNP